MRLGAQAAVETLDLLIEGDGSVPTTAQAELQAGELRPAPKIFKQTCCLDFKLNAKQVYDFIRAMSPHPGAWTMIDGGQGGQPIPRTALLPTENLPLPHTHEHCPRCIQSEIRLYIS